MEIYLDESGDLGGLGHKTSESRQYFVLAALVGREDLPIKRCIKDIRRKKIKKKYKKISELKFSDSDDTIRRRVLECIGRTNNDIAYALLRKSQVNENLCDKPQKVYNFLTKNLIYRILSKYEVSGGVDIIVDKSLYGVQRANFDDYLAGRIGASMPVEINVSHVDSRQCSCIQAVDFIAGAINRKYRDNDDRYYGTIEGRICIALDFFEKENSIM